MEVVTSKPSPKTLDIFDIVYSSGFKDSITIDKSLGDSYQYTQTAGCPTLVITGAPRQSIINEDEKLPAEDLVIILANTACISHRTRVVQEEAPEVKKAMAELIKRLKEKKSPFQLTAELQKQFTTEETPLQESITQ